MKFQGRVSDALVTIEELKETFVVSDTPYGKCIVIPARMFGPAWEEDLKKQGCKIFSGSSEGQTAFFVKLPNAKTPEETPRMVYQPNGSRRGEHLGRLWTEEEDKRLIELAKQKLTYEKIAQQMPSRTENSVRVRIGRLEKKGLLPSRPKRKYRRKQKTKPPRISDFGTAESLKAPPEISSKTWHIEKVIDSKLYCINFDPENINPDQSLYILIDDEGFVTFLEPIKKETTQ